MRLSSSSSSSSVSLNGRRARGLFFSASGESDDLLLCGEDAGSFSDEEGDDSRRLRRGGKHADVDDDDDDGGEEEEEVVAMWVGVEGDYSPAMGYRARFLALPGSLDPDARRLAVSWILKVREFYSFQPATAYLAVNYMDRFLSRHALPPQPAGWPMQLLSVGCLSLAAKMEESLVPSLLDLQVEDARFVFEPRTIQRMELLVLDALGWRLRSITPFAVLGFFACRADPRRAYARCMVSRATHIILDSVQAVEFLDHCPSAMAAAAIMCAASEVPSLPSISPESAASWCAGLTADGITNCHQLMAELVMGSGWKPQQQQQQQQRRPRVLPQLRITTSVSMSSGVLSSSSTFSSSNKRRKLNSCGWVGDGKERPMGEGGAE